MTRLQARRAATECRMRISHLMDIEPVENKDASTLFGRGAHCLWMLDTLMEWPEDRLEKAFRWLGFVQGWMWAVGIVTIEELRKWNMPAEAVT